jgi:hypothetical protein
MAQIIQEHRCSGCRCLWEPTETDVKPSGAVYKTCNKCREKKKQYKLANADKIKEQRKPRDKQYYLANTDKIKAQRKQYNLENKDKLKAQQKQYNLDHADEIKAYRKQYNLENKDKLKAQQKKYRLDHTDEIKEQRKPYLHKYYLDNADKISEYNRLRYLKNSDKMLAKQKLYYLDNPEKVKEQRKRYKLANADKIKEQNKQYRVNNLEKVKQQKKRYKLDNADKIKQYYNDIKNNNPLLYLAILQRGQINRCMKLTTKDKKEHSIEYLGCSHQDFYNFIKIKMDNWNTDNPENIMTFNNIHIDHIKPISRFEFVDDNELLDCCNYTNLQPLLAIDNLRKNNKWTDENEIFWNANIKGNVEYFDIYM